MAPGPGQPRLSCRGRGLPLLGAARADPRAGRRAPDQPHRRGVPSWPAGRGSSAPLRRTPARDRSGSHAARAPALCRVDPGALPALGSRDRAPHGGAHPGGARQPPPSRAGPSHLPGCAAPLPQARPGPGRSGLRPGRRDRRAHLHEYRLHPGPQSRPRPAAGRERASHRPSQRARLALLPLTEAFMLAHPTVDLLHALGLHGMAKGYQEIAAHPEARALDHAEWLGLLLEHEVTSHRQKRFETRARAARLRHPASIEDVDYRTHRGLDRALFLKLAACDWIRSRRNLLITGPCGVGKSWLACALGHKACREDLSVLYYRVPRLFTALALARGDGRYGKLLRQLARANLLILDDWGPEPLLPEQARDLLEIVEDRYDAGSLLITSQVPVDRWYDMIVSVARESGSERLLIAAVVGRVPCSRSGRGCRRAPQWRQHFLNFLPLPHGQGSFRPTPLNGSTDDWGVSAYARPASPGLVARRS